LKKQNRKDFRQQKLYRSNQSRSCFRDDHKSATSFPLLPRNTQFIHHFIECGAADSEFFGGAGEVALMLVQGIQYEVSFDLLPGFLEGPYTKM